MYLSTAHLCLGLYDPKQGYLAVIHYLYYITYYFYITYIILISPVRKAPQNIFEKFLVIHTVLTSFHGPYRHSVL